MKIVFFGTPHFAACVLKYLVDKKQNIVAVVTQPDRPQKRSNKPMPPPVKQYLLSEGLNIPILQPEKASTEDMQKRLSAYEPDLFVVVGYGEILKQNILDIPKKAPINIHASSLPKYRGAAPIQRAIMNGDKYFGITIIEMVKKMDAGDMLYHEEIACDASMNFEKIEAALIDLANKSIIHTIENFNNFYRNRKSQDEQNVTFASKITSEDCQINWDESANNILSQIRALSPKPGAFAMVSINGSLKRMKILKAHIDVKSGVPAQILSYNNCLQIACGENSLSLEIVQLEGKKSMSIKAFLQGIQSLKIIKK